MKVLSDEHGQVTVFIALFMGLLMLGFLAFALDAGYLFHEKRMAQSAADAAVVAAAEEGGVTASGQAAADAVAKLNGFDTTLTKNPATVALSTSQTGIYSNAGSAPAPGGGWLTAVVSQPVHTFFLGAFNHEMQTVTVTASAVAGLQTSPTCVCLTSPSGMDLNMSNDAKLSAAGCKVESDSDSSNAIGIVGSASVCAKTLSSPSTNWDNSSNINNAGTICPTATAVQGAPACVPPAFNPPALPPGIVCNPNPIQGWVLPGWTANYTLPLQNVTLTNGKKVNNVPVDNVVCYTSLDTSRSSSVTFTPGYTYYIQGDFTTGGGAPISGSDVTFYVGGNIVWANGVTATLSAPTVGGIPQTLFYVNGTSVSIQGGDNSNLSGTLDAPNASVNLANGTGTTMSMDIIAQSLTMAGGATLNTYLNPNLGGGSASGGTLVQ